MGRVHKWLALSLVMVVGGLTALNSLAAGVVAAEEIATPVKLIVYEGAVAQPQFAGRVEAGESAQLAFRVEGQLQKLRVKMGQEVVAGQLLASLDASDFQLNLDARQAEFDLAKVRADRAKSLFQRKLVSEDQFDTTQAHLATAKAKLEQAREQLSFCNLSAPFNGSVAFTYARSSEVVAAHQRVINLQDTSSLDVHFNLPDQFQHLLKDRASLDFKVIFDLLPDVAIVARIKEVNLQPNSDTNNYKVSLNLTPPEDFSGRAGMSAQVLLNHPSLMNGGWRLPRDAVIERTAMTAYVWRVDLPSMRLDKVGVTVNELNQVVGGLEQGDHIVSAGVEDLVEGQTVRAWVREGGL